MREGSGWRATTVESGSRDVVAIVFNHLIMNRLTSRIRRFSTVLDEKSLQNYAADRNAGLSAHSTTT